jgi:chromosomal replication initiator protein
MSEPHGCNDGKDVVGLFKEALKQRVGTERFQIWFAEVLFECRSTSESGSDPSELVQSELVQSERVRSGHADSDSTAVPVPFELVAVTRGQFAADRLAKDFLSQMRGAAAQAVGRPTKVRIEVNAPPARQAELPLEVDCGKTRGKVTGSSTEPAASKSARNPVSQNARGKARTRKNAQSMREILAQGTNSRKPSGNGRVASARNKSTGSAGNGDTPSGPSASAARPGETSSANADGETWETFIGGPCNELARTACKMTIESPSIAAPLILWGPPGSGKSHLLRAVAKKLRSVHRFRRVLYLSAEEFTNDFIKALNTSCLPAFRSRFQDADALLIDDIQFFVEKKATSRELLRTLEMLAGAGKALVFASTKSPSELKELGSELSGRLASGLVCQVQSLDATTRRQLLSRYASTRCPLPWPEETLGEIADVVDGDGRVLSGVVNLVGLLQRMDGAMPSMEKIRQHGGHLLRASGVPITLSAIERAVEKIFQLDTKSLQSSSQAKSVTEPRMLAMFLSREMTSSAFSEIGGHFGGRSHSTAILANQRVRQWLDDGRSIGRGRSAIAAEEAIRRIESMLKTG